jgi:hypothetical protein
MKIILCYDARSRKHETNLAQDKFKSCFCEHDEEIPVFINAVNFFSISGATSFWKRIIFVVFLSPHDVGLSVLNVENDETRT